MSDNRKCDLMARLYSRIWGHWDNWLATTHYTKSLLTDSLCVHLFCSPHQFKLMSFFHCVWKEIDHTEINCFPALDSDEQLFMGLCVVFTATKDKHTNIWSTHCQEKHTLLHFCYAHVNLYQLYGSCYNSWEDKCKKYGTESRLKLLNCQAGY